MLWQFETSEQKFRLELSLAPGQTGTALKMISNLCRLTAPVEVKVGGLCAALDPDISHQNQPQVVGLRPGPGGEPPSRGRGRADLLRVQTGVRVESLLVDQARDVLPPGPLLDHVSKQPDLWRGGLYEDRDRDLVTGLQVRAHGDGAGGGHVALEVVIREVGGKVSGGTELPDGGYGEVVLLLPGARHLVRDLLLVYRQRPDGALLGERSLVLQTAASEQVGDGGVEVFIELRIF